MPATNNTTGTESRSCDSTNTGVTSSNNPLHLFNSPAYYQQNSSSPPPSSSSAQSYSGVVPPASYTFSISCQFSISKYTSKSQTFISKCLLKVIPIQIIRLEILVHHLVMFYLTQAFARAAAAAAAAAGGPTSAALFHTLSGRVQHLMSRVGGGSSIKCHERTFTTVYARYSIT